jgi:hypothetical protein
LIRVIGPGGGGRCGLRGGGEELVGTESSPPTGG